MILPKWPLYLLLAATCAICHGQVTVLPATGPQPTITDEAGRRVPLYGASHALLVSQKNYVGVARRGWRQLEATDREMDSVAASLRKHGFNIWRANDLTGSQLISVFRDFMAEFGYEPNNRLLLFYSGHGYTNPQNDMGYIVPVDALDPNITPAGFYSKAVPIETIQTWARELTARHVLFIFDSCFSGSIFVSRASVTAPEARGASSTERLAFFKGSSFKPVRQFIAAGGPKEELPSASVFVPLLLEGLDGRASRSNDGYISGKELGLWIEQVLPKYRPTQNPHSGVIRQPELSFGDMVFQVPERALPAALAPPAPPPPAAPPQMVATAPLAVPAAVVAAPLATAAPGSLPSRPTLQKVTFANDSFFDYAKADLRPESLPRLDDLIAKARGVSLEVIIAVGHTDSVEAANPATRQRLSVQRAEAIKAYMNAKGIEKNRIYTEGKGDTQPVADNRTAEGRAKNRRVEMEVVGTQAVLR